MNDTPRPQPVGRTVAAEVSNRTRWLVRAACLAVAVGLLVSGGFWARGPLWVPAGSPFVAAAGCIAARTLHAGAILGLLIGAITLVRRRWFCRWVCPTGLCADTVSRLSIRGGRRAPRVPRLGPWIFWLTLAGALLGYPVLLWLDPLALFSGLFTVFGPQATAAAWWAAWGLPLVLLLSVWLPAAWCARLCPLGAMQDFVFLAPGPPTAARDPQAVRRTVLAAGLGLLCATATRRLRAAAPAALRPPGALDEFRFLGVCVRCGNCVRACPPRIIRPDLGDHGLAGLLAPKVGFEDNFCAVDCTRCMDVCPSGALQPFSVENKLRAPIGLAHVNMDICYLAEERECGICRNECPYEAVKLVFDSKTYIVTPTVDPSKCPGCGACEAACPTEPKKAIFVLPIGQTPHA